MNRIVFALALAAVVVPVVAHAQALSIGARVGTLGIGPEVGVGINPRLALRAGTSVGNYEFNSTFGENEYSVGVPSIWNVGVELSPFGGSFHLGGGLLHRSRVELSGRYSGQASVGDENFQGTVALEGFLKNEKETGPYGSLGFGRMTKRGFGVSFDLGVAQLGDGKVQFTKATCTGSNGQPCPNQAQFQAAVQREAAKASDDVGTYFKWHPILSLSLHYGFGR